MELKNLMGLHENRRLKLQELVNTQSIYRGTQYTLLCSSL